MFIGPTERFSVDSQWSMVDGKRSTICSGPGGPFTIDIRQSTVDSKLPSLHWPKQTVDHRRSFGFFLYFQSATKGL
jgi:hypothetical protein